MCFTAGVIDVAQQIKQDIEEFKPYIPLIQGLRNPGMRQRHWDIVRQISLSPHVCLLATSCKNYRLDVRDDSTRCTP